MADELANLEFKLDKDFKKDERLFHYTSSRGLYGILESECLWATHFRYLNDSREFFAAKKSLLQFLDQEILKKLAVLKVNGELIPNDGVSLKEMSSHEARVVVGAMYSATLNIADPFIFSSFISDPAEKGFRDGLLLHWATYGRDGGYALEINPHKFMDLFGKDNVLSRRAFYVENDIPPDLQADYSELGRIAQEMTVGRLKNNLENVDLGASAGPFLRIASVIKDDFFKDEREARLVTMRFKPDKAEAPVPKIFIRHSTGGAIPYIKLFEKKLFGDGCPIESIVIGPHPDRERREVALRLALESQGLGSIKIFQSEVPYLSG